MANFSPIKRVDSTTDHFTASITYVAIPSFQLLPFCLFGRMATPCCHSADSPFLLPTYLREAMRLKRFDHGSYEHFFSVSIFLQECGNRRYRFQSSQKRSDDSNSAKKSQLSQIFFAETCGRINRKCCSRPS